MLKKLIYIFSLCLISILFSCNNNYLQGPVYTGGAEDTFANRNTFPTNLVASQGKKGVIELSWNPVPRATRYEIFTSKTPYDSFTQKAEVSSSSTTISIKYNPGADVYFKVRAIDNAENPSTFSSLVRGTNLAQPFISDISGVSGSEDTSVIVSWYMSNVEQYRENVRYTVICYDQSNTEVQRIGVGSGSATQVQFDNLLPNSSFSYKVEAFLVTDQDSVESSEKVDAETARRLRPNPPENLVSSEGDYGNKVVLSLELPDLVDVYVSKGVYSQNPIYFKVYRRIKTMTDEIENEYGLICSYWGYNKNKGTSFTELGIEDFLIWNK